MFIKKHHSTLCYLPPCASGMPLTDTAFISACCLVSCFILKLDLVLSQVTSLSALLRTHDCSNVSHLCLIVSFSLWVSLQFCVDTFDPALYSVEFQHVWPLILDFDTSAFSWTDLCLLLYKHLWILIRSLSLQTESWASDNFHPEVKWVLILQEWQRRVAEEGGADKNKTISKNLNIDAELNIKCGVLSVALDYLLFFLMRNPSVIAKILYMFELHLKTALIKARSPPISSWVLES